MDAETNRRLIGNQITRLASAIEARYMVMIAEGFMDISYDSIKNMQYESNYDSATSKGRIIRHFVRKIPGPHQFQVNELKF